MSDLTDSWHKCIARFALGRDIVYRDTRCNHQMVDSSKFIRAKVDLQKKGLTGILSAGGFLIAMEVSRKQIDKPKQKYTCDFASFFSSRTTRLRLRTGGRLDYHESDPQVRSSHSHVPFQMIISSLAT